MQRSTINMSSLYRSQTPIKSDKVMPMERLSINNGGGQGYGFILYQTILQKFPKEIVMEDVLDRAQVGTSYLRQDIYKC